MRILSVRQPWAAAIIHAGKDVENRVRSLGPYTGPVAIAASLSYDSKAALNDAQWEGLRGVSCPTGVIIGVVDLVETHLDRATVACNHGSCDAWGEDGVYHLRLANPRRILDAIPYSGGLGLRHAPPELEEWIRAGVDA